MKKISKFLLSFCMAFVVAFSLVGCNNNSDNSSKGDEGDDNSTSISMSEFILELMENIDTTASYEATIVVHEGDVTKNKSLKYVYREEGTEKGGIVLSYEDDELKKGLIIIASGTSYTVGNMNVEEKTVQSETKTKLEMLKERANIHCAYGVMLLPYQVELNQGYQIGTDVSTIPAYSGSIVNDEVENPSTGKYILTRTITVGTSSSVYKLTVQNNKVINCQIQIGDNYLNATYEYKEVTITEDFSDYTWVD